MYGKFRTVALLISLAGFLAFAGCAKKHVAANVPTPPPPPPAPTATLAANPATIQQGQSTHLTWSTQNATDVTIDGIGKVSGSGSRTVTPSASITYNLTAKGNGGTADASARVTVNPVVAVAPPAASLDDLFKQNVKDLFFDYDKYNVRSDDQQALASTAQFLQQHPTLKVVIEGHCDERGSDEYNIGLGDNRASATRDALMNLGIGADRIRTISYGKEKPFCTEDTEQCFQLNRRGHFVIDR